MCDVLVLFLHYLFVYPIVFFGFVFPLIFILSECGGWTGFVFSFLLCHHLILSLVLFLFVSSLFYLPSFLLIFVVLLITLCLLFLFSF